MMNVSEVVAEFLAEKEIKHAFGIIGGGNVILWDAIACHGKTEIIACHHEQAAAMAATYYWRTCGKVAAVLVTTGAGSTNALTGVAAAWMDSIPILVLSGNEATQHHSVGGRGWGFQGYDSSKVAAPFCKLASRMCKGDDYKKYLEWHLESALECRQGPVWVDIPKDLQNEIV